MDASRLDRISKRFAARRLSRRETLAQTGKAIAAGALAAAIPTINAMARDATPVAINQNPEMLFVQVFEQGSVLRKKMS